MRNETGVYSPMLGRKHSIKTRKNMTLSRIGNTNNLGNKATKETRKKQSLAKLGKVTPKNVRKKQSESHKGKKHSAETIQKMRLAQQARQARVRSQNGN